MPRKRKYYNKICEECGKEYIVTSGYKDQRFCSKKCSNHNKSVINKMKQSQLETYRKNYGVDHPMKTKRVVKNFESSMLEKHGVKHALNKKEFVDKMKQTLLTEYGAENYNNLEKMKDTNLIKHGVDNPMKNEEIKKRSINTRRIIHYNKIVKVLKKLGFTVLFTEDEYIGYKYYNKYKFECDECGNIFTGKLNILDNLYCNKCHPDKRLSLEYSFFEFLKGILPNNIEIQRNNREILHGKEVDIFIPEYRIGFEINGLYWHGEVSKGRNRLYHLNKTKNCLFHGINLIQINEDDWLYKTKIIESIIRNKLNITDKLIKIGGRECKIKEINNKNDADIFLNNNNLYGSDNSSIRIGLYYNDELVSILTLIKFKNSNNYEISRYCNKLNTFIIGGADKLLKYFIKTYKVNTITAYVDKRIFGGNLYKKLNFNFIKNTAPDYDYISEDYKDLINKHQFKKKYLKNILLKYDEKLSEWENMKNNGYDRLWDCGYAMWQLIVK